MATLHDQLAAAGFDPGRVQTLVDLAPQPILRLSHPGGDAAVTAWRKLRAIADATGHWPVLLGTEEEVGYREDLEDVTADVDRAIQQQ